MCNNFQRNFFLMQIMATIVSIYTHLTMVWIDRFEAMRGENVTVNFF